MSSSDHPKWMAALQSSEGELNTNAQCVALADFTNDGDTKLIVADLGTSRFNLKMKVYKGVQKVNELVLAETPIALITFINEQISVPAIGVACGPSLYVYKGLKPFYKYDPPPGKLNEVEATTWKKLHDGELSAAEAVHVLNALKEEVGMRELTPQTHKVLMSADSERNTVADQLKGKTPVNKSAITCCATMKRSLPDVSPIDVIIIGCEDGMIHIVDTQTFLNPLSVQVPGTPVFISSYGVWEVDSRVFVSTRDGHVYAIKRDEPINKDYHPIITTKYQIVSMITFGKGLAVACCDGLTISSLTFYSKKGKRINSTEVRERIMGLELFHYAPKQYTAVIVAMQNEVRFYNQVALMHIIKVDSQLKWIKFGPFGREDAALILGMYNGSMQVKLFRRTATMEEIVEIKTPILPHAYKLNIPKRTKMYMDQTQRERDNPSQMHQIYQRDLFLLRFLVSQQFNLLTTKALSSVSTSSSESVDISVEVHGFGPIFRLTVRLSCGGKSPLTDMWISFVYNSSNFKFENSLIPVCIITPDNVYTFTTKVEALQPEKGLTDDVKVYLIRKDRPTPIVTAIVTMPLSEMSLLD